METSKAKVAKSKSSNSAIDNNNVNKRSKPESHKKKSKSNAEFQTLEVKKRGMYVAKNSAKTSLGGRELDAGQEMKEGVLPKPPKRPHRGSKKFLASVLTILSKSSTGTQHPNSDNNKAKKDKSTKEPIQHTLADIPSVDLDKKKKYRSKVLNGNKYHDDNFEVLQCKRELVQTPSNFTVKSDKEDTKWMSELPRLVPQDPDETSCTLTSNKKYETLVREVTEGKKLVEKKVKVVDPDPTTLVGEQSERRDDKRLYNFFVDLLESTFSVYNVKAKYDAAPIPPSTCSSKIALEIDESVAKKLNVGTGMQSCVSNKPSKQHYSIRNENNNWNDDSLIDYFTPKRKIIKDEYQKPVCKQRKTVTNDGKRQKKVVSQNRKIIPPKSQSAVMAEERPKFYRRNKKRDLLNTLKEELRMDNVASEEPQNLYQALKIMAKHKRRTKEARTIHFETTKQNSEKRPVDCMLKGRRSLLSKTHKNEEKGEIARNHNQGPIAKRFSDYGHRKTQQEPVAVKISNHSLEVYDFETFSPNLKQMKIKQRKRASSPLSSSSENDELINMRRYLMSQRGH